MKGIRLMVIDVDGTLLTPDKVLTERAARAVRELRQEHVEVALTSGRPPRGLRMLIEPLGLTTPLAAFNGGMFVKPDLTIIEQRTLPPEAARRVVALIQRHGLDVWVYRDADWYITDPKAPHVDREQRTVQFAPTVVAGLGSLLDKAVKIVGVSDDLDAVARCEAEAQHLDGVYAARSQPYYLDVTHPDANKGMVVKYLSRLLSIPRGQTATIGDMPNDVQMFRGSRVSIAMGNASADMKHQARHVTRSNTEEGFAHAVEDIVLPEVRDGGVAERTRRSAKGRPHVVVVGAGFGGLLAARGLRQAPARVTVIDRRNHHLFQPLLYQVATAGLGPNEIAYPIRSVFRKQQNTTVMMAEVKGVDLAERLLALDDGTELTYDYLVIATGAKTSYFGHEEWSEFAPGLKSLEDALALRQRVFLSLERAERQADARRQHDLLTFVVVGGGPTGVELAGALAELLHGALRRDFRAIHPENARVLLLEAGPAVLPSFPSTLQRKAAQRLKKLGVEVRLSTQVQAVDAAGVIAKGARIGAGTVLWAAGVEASPLAASLGVPLDRKGRVLVTGTLNVPNHPEVFVAGDLAALEQRGRPVPGVATAAIQEGRYVARAIQRSLAEKAAIRPFRFVDKGELAAIGRGTAVASLPRRIRLSGAPAWFLWVGVHVLYLIGFRNRVAVMLEWAWAYVTRRSRPQIITGGMLPKSGLTESRGPSKRCEHEVGKSCAAERVSRQDGDPGAALHASVRSP
jgi:NADH:ubiquinone reductase (H+-translocating)